MDLELTGKRAVVTGASRGIGKQVARILIEEGASVALVARQIDGLRATAAEFGPNSFPVTCDTSQDASVKSMVELVVEKFGEVDILVNCATQPGGQAPAPKLNEITDQVFWDDVNVKVMGYLRCIREFAPHLKAGARIVNISGLAARQTGSIIGSIRNAGVVALTKNVADELSPRGISAIVVHPGTVRTERTPDVIANRAQQLGLTQDEVLAAMSRNLLGRLLDAGEIANVVAFLCSPKAIAINGSAVEVSGGVPTSIYY
jgi:NAD(P)-dependent dehydrogenase (short-subunit alcohol dehydrogenase family)